MDNDGYAHVTEYYYNKSKLAKAEGKPLVEIVRSLGQALRSGEYKDTTGLAEHQEVNGDIRRRSAESESGHTEAIFKSESGKVLFRGVDEREKLDVEAWERLPREEALADGGSIKREEKHGNFIECRYNKAGKMEGVQKEWYNNGQLSQEMNYKDGNKDGLQKSWYENGKLKHERSYKDGKPDGVHREWFKNGQLSLENNYKDGKQDGLQKQWNEDGQLTLETNIKDGKPYGVHREWYDNGQLQSERFYKDGKQDGVEKSWFENGKLKSKWFYKDGKQDGQQKLWYNNGQLWLEAYYKDGKLDGVQREWNAKGKLVKETEIFGHRKIGNEEFDETRITFYGKDGSVNRVQFVNFADKSALSDSSLTDEERGIVERAKSDGSYLKAPNGRESLLGEKQWAQVRTRAFKAWFGDWERDPLLSSKVVDENGEPLVVYHGTRKFGFTEFDKRMSDDGRSVFATSEPLIARSYTGGAKVEHVDSGAKEGLYGLYMDMRDPMIVYGRGGNWNRLRTEEGSPVQTTREIAREAERRGKDGVIILGVHDFGGLSGDVNVGGNVYISLKDGAALKSATDNSGAFSAGNADIRYRTISDEEKEIAERAKWEGTYMKAPNGRPSRLSPEMWMQVRTKAFKDWFGDWEKAARIEKLRHSEPMAITGEEITPSADIREYKHNALQYGKRLQGEYTNKDTGNVIQLQLGRKNGGLKEVLQHDTLNDTAQIKSVAAIPQIIENAIYIDSAENADTEKNPRVKAYHYYVCGLKIGAEDYTVRMVEAEENDGSRYYDHKLTRIEKGKLFAELAQLKFSSPTELSSTRGPGATDRNRPTDRGGSDKRPCFRRQRYEIILTPASELVKSGGRKR